MLSSLNFVKLSIFPIKMVRWLCTSPLFFTVWLVLPMIMHTWFTENESFGKQTQFSSVSDEKDGLGIQNCLCQLSGSLGDCGCDVESIDSYNSRLIYPAIRQLSFRDYFKFYKVNLNHKCQFWHDDGRCVLRDCAVEACPVESIPSQLISQSNKDSNDNLDPDTSDEKSPIKETSENDEKASDVTTPSCSTSADGNGDDQQQQSAANDAEALGSIDETITDQMLKEFAVWEKRDDEMNDDNFCYLENETDPEAFYVDLTLNPERFTGYSGASAHRVWESIYRENCFKVQEESDAEKQLLPDEKQFLTIKTRQKHKFDEILNSYTMERVCTEKRVFFRLISGLHASISVHLAAKYLLKGHFGDLNFGYNLSEFRQRFDPVLTNNEGPQRLKNIYFLYLVEMKAILRAAPVLSKLNYFTNVEETDVETKSLVSALLDSIAKFPKHFDEQTLFRDKEVQSLKQVYKTQFRNISRIMDCVGCDKCKLWGKIQTQGLGTALKILFSDFNGEGADDRPGGSGKRKPSRNPKLTRTEIVALFNAFAQLSESIWHIQEFRERASKHFKHSEL